MPNTLRDEIRLKYHLQLYFRTHDGKYTEENSFKAPPPIPSFAQMAFPEELVRFVTRNLKFDRPTGFQMQALPIVLSEQNAIMVGPHSCGKTLTYILPTITKIFMQEISLSWSEDEEPYAVICSTSLHK